MSSATNPLHPTGWHAGEVQMQRTVGAVEKMASVGPRALRPFMLQQHRDFFEQLPMLVVGTADERGLPWASLLGGAPGFVHTPDETHIQVTATHDPTDPGGLRHGAPVGVLGIELPTRRRNRANGRVVEWSPDQFVIEVEQSFGNCPRYISRRTPRFVRDPAVPPKKVEALNALDEDARRLIRTADTFFVASFARRDGGLFDVDVSHRGGPAGFVQLSDAGVLTIPDFAGNHFFNTLGNFVSNPVAGLLFVDFERGDTLQLTGDAEVVLDGTAARHLDGAERMWRVQPRAIIRRREAVPLTFEELSPPSGAEA